MADTIVLDFGALCSAHGSLLHTADALALGQSAIGDGPCFGVDVQWAPLQDASLRDPCTCARSLIEQLPHALPTGNRVLFVYCAAKGDLRGLDRQSGGNNGPVESSALLSVQAERCHEVLGVHAGRTTVISNACASGTIAIETSIDLLRAGIVDHAVLMGFDTLSRFVASGFFALGALSPTVARPFGANRDGLSLGEGAALAVLSRRDALPGDIVVCGAGSSNDANHRTGPSRTGEGLYRAAAAALRDAHVEPREVGGVKCHGTATPYNDAMEAKALTTLFGGDYPPCVSLKGGIGHTSGGGSLLEVLLAAEFIRRGSLPPTVGFEELGVDEPVPISTQPSPLRSPSVLCLSAGFGGVNAAVLLKGVSS